MPTGYFEPMDKNYLSKQLGTVEKHIGELEREQRTATFDRSVEITRLLSHLRLKSKSLKQRIDLDKPTGIMEHSIANH